MRLCWADKVPLALFGLVTLVMLLLAGTAGGFPNASEYCQMLRLEHPTWTGNDSTCFVTAAQHWSALLGILGFLFLKFILPVWVVCRLLDIVGSGPAVRRYNRVIRRGGTIEEARLASEPEPERMRERDWLRRLKRPDHQAADKAWLRQLEDAIDPSGSLTKGPRLDLGRGEWKTLKPER